VTESYFISNEKEIEKEWLVNKNNIGITGATSTPLWLLEKVHNQVISLTNPQEAEDH
jgi:4-hydroxy-3-methylbut-2-enyl diphosphate reductase